jgi:hypothetical protein
MAESRNFNASATGFLTIQPIKGLRLRSQFNYWWSSGAYRNYNEPRSTGYGNATSVIYSVSQSGSMNTGFSVENTLTYDLPIISGHKISAMVGQSFQSSAWSSNISGSNKVSYGDQLATLKGWNSAWLSNIKLNNITDVTLTGNPNDEEYLASWFGRLTWDWNERYMATVTMRYDGSSIFTDGKRWGFFPSVSAGWVVSNEPFMTSLRAGSTSSNSVLLGVRMVTTLSLNISIWLLSLCQVILATAVISSVQIWLLLPLVHLT